MTVLHECASANFGIVGLAAKDPTDCRLRGHVRIKFSEKCRQLLSPFVELLRAYRAHPRAHRMFSPYIS